MMHSDHLYCKPFIKINHSALNFRFAAAQGNYGYIKIIILIKNGQNKNKNRFPLCVWWWIDETWQLTPELRF